MATKYYWIGSIGPFAYDDAAPVGDPDLLYDGVAAPMQGGIVTSGNVVGQSYIIAGKQLLTVQQAAEADAAAVTAVSLTAGADTVDIATCNVDLGTLVTEINAIKTTLNNLLTKLRTHGLIAT